MTQTDRTGIVIVGGGLAGLAAAALVSKTGREVILLAPATAPDRRTSALMHPSVRILQHAGLLDDPDALGHALTEIRIIDATNRLIRAPETLFRAQEAGHPAFGWNFANATLSEAFRKVLSGRRALQIRETALSTMERRGGRWHLTLEDGSGIDTEIVVGADGKTSRVRELAGIMVRRRDLGQHALVADLDLARPLGGTSVEFHYPNGPFTLVPAGGNRANLVWIDEPARLEEAKAMDQTAFAECLGQKAQHLFGGITPVSPAFTFPLSTLSAEVAGRNGVVLIGESAHAFPPIGAQGLNLGLRDVADLEKVLENATYDLTGRADEVSKNYADRRRADLARTATFVDGLYRSLLSGMLPAQALRAGSLWALKALPSLRRSAFAIGMGQR